MAKKLSAGILSALKKYYLHRTTHHVKGEWNKEADLERIYACAKKDGWVTDTVSGHFWFSRKSIVGTVIIEVTENTVENGGKSNVSGDDPFNLFSDWINPRPPKRNP